jgi:hypothetical protein
MTFWYEFVMSPNRVIPVQVYALGFFVISARFMPRTGRTNCISSE